MGLDPASDFPIDEQIQALYIAYFDRAAEPDGLAYWRERYESEIADGNTAGETIARFASAFAEVGEARTAFPFLDDPGAGGAENFVESVFLALFNRVPEGEADDVTTGLGFWVDRIGRQVADQVPLGNSVLSILAGARNDDRALVENKIAAADAYTDRLAEAGLAYDPAEASALLKAVRADMSETQARAVGSQDSDGAVTATVEIASDPSFLGLADEIEANAREALDLVLSYLDPAPGNIEVAIEAVDSGALATGGSTYFSNDARPDGGVPSVFAKQLISGEDSNGTTGDNAADVTISLSRDNIDRLDFGDGNGDFDAVNVFTHELFHGLGVSSFRGSSETIETVWDQYLAEQADGSYVFTGPNAMAANSGEPVALESDDPAHLSEAEFTSALMTPKAEFGGGEVITDLDVALLADLGLPMADGFAIA